MIPKIIHYCWLSNNTYPEKLQICMKSWKKYLPDYEFILWNTDRFDINSSVWVKQAVEAKKYAFAADYIRLYALHNYGGIYLDMDVEVIKPFDDLLNLPYFIGREHYPIENPQRNPIEAATIGAEKGIFWVEKCLNYYQNRKFIKWNGVYDELPLPTIIETIIKEYYELTMIFDKKSVMYDEKNVFLLPVDFFSPKEYFNEGKLYVTANTYSIHHFDDAWKWETSKQRILRFIFEKRGLILLKMFVKRILSVISNHKS